MKLSIIGITLLSLWTVHAQNITNSLPKTKRNLSRDVQSYGESGLILPYNDNPKVYYEPKQVNAYQVRPLALVDLSQPVKVIEPKVAAQQVLYEFQQTPTDAVSNVHVKQLFEQDLKPPPQNSPPNLITSESVSPAVHHGQFLPNPSHHSFNHKQHPLYNVQPTFLEPKKYVYGKIIVDSTSPQQPNFHHHGNPNVFYSNQPFLPQGSHGKPIVNYVNHFPRNNVVMPPTESPHIIPQNKFKPPPKSQYQPIDKPTRGNLEQKPKHKPVEKPVTENEEAEEEEHEERPNYREEEEDREEYESPFDKYFEDEESSEYGHYENTEDDDEVEEDNKRGSSKYVSKREKQPKKYKMTKSYYSKYTSSPEDRYFKNDGKKHNKSHKNKNYKKSKSPSHELEGKYSEHIPVTHKKKILKEKWYVSKSLADKERYDHES